LMLHEMQVDKQPFPINTMQLQQPKVLVRPHQAEATKGKNVMVGEAKLDLRGKELTREVAYEKTPNGRETFKITVNASGHGGQGSSTPSGQHTTEPVLDRAVRPGVQGGQTAPAHGRPKMLIPKRPEIGNWKLNVAKNQGSVPKPKVTFDMLFDKYSKQKAVTSDRPVKKRMRSPPHQERPALSPRAAIRFRGESSQRQDFTPDWAPPLRPIYDDNGVMCVPYQQSFHPGWEGPRRSALDRISRHTQNSWAPRQTGQGHLADPVRPPTTGGQTALPRKKDFLRKRCTGPKSERRKFRRWTSTQRGLLALILFRLGQ
jgi:hypothetical protein